LSERPVDGTKRTDRVEIVEVLILALVAMATAWSGYQATQWGGRQATLYGQASTTRFAADASSTRGGQILVADATFFTAWLQARSAGDGALQADLVQRFSASTERRSTRGSRPIPSPIDLHRQDPPTCRGSISPTSCRRIS
jgi:hypothetical protein